MVIECRKCGRIFYVCQCCWRGQAYCSGTCRVIAQREAHNKSQRIYRRTDKGRKAHQEDERRRRMRLSKKTVDDDSSPPPISHDTISAILFFITPCCHFCGAKGVVVDRFPRRGHGGRRITAHIDYFILPGGLYGSLKSAFQPACSKN